MAYVPPQPGSTTPGQPTPEGVPKQSAHITDLPPEVRKSFLMSMVFFPSMIGAAICALMFLGWMTIFKPKAPTQYALELESPDMRRRWSAARELAEHIRPYGEKHDSPIYSAEIVNALIKILDNPDLDSEASEWSPSSAGRQNDERGSLRGWAAMILGHIASQMKDPDHENAYKALSKALDDKALTIQAAIGLARFHDPRAIEGLVRHMNEDADSGFRIAAAEALGSIGWGEMQRPDVAAGTANAEKVRNALRAAYQTENAKAKRDELMLDNLAIALARVKDSTAQDRLHILEKHADVSVRDQARRALEILNGPPPKSEK